jgi:hypothetical protein
MGQCFCYAKNQCFRKNLLPGDVFPCLLIDGRYVRFMIFHFTDQVSCVFKPEEQYDVACTALGNPSAFSLLPLTSSKLEPSFCSVLMN